MHIAGFVLDKRGKPMMPHQWEKRFQHVVEKYNRIYRVQLPDNTTCVPSYILHECGVC